MIYYELIYLITLYSWLNDVLNVDYWVDPSMNVNIDIII